MPNITTTLYVSDDDYNNKFLPNKTQILQSMRDAVRKEMGISTKTKFDKE